MKIHGRSIRICAPRNVPSNLRAIAASLAKSRRRLSSNNLLPDRRIDGKAMRIVRPPRASSSELEAETLRDIPVLERVKFGTVTRVFSQEELDMLFREYPRTLTVLECKAKYCRPCSAFAKKYANFAEEFSDVLFLEIVGDENKQTRLMMIEFEVKATPTFRYYLEGECVTVTVGIKQEKLRDAICFFRPQQTQTETK